MTTSVVSIGSVDTQDTAFAKVRITNADGKRSWYHFRSRKAWGTFFKLWQKMPVTGKNRGKMLFDTTLHRFYLIKE